MFCNMLSILNEITLQKELHNIVTKWVFDKKCKCTATTKHKIKHKKPLTEPKIKTGTSRTPVGCVTLWPLGQLKASIDVKLFSC